MTMLQNRPGPVDGARPQRRRFVVACKPESTKACRSRCRTPNDGLRQSLHTVAPPTHTHRMGDALGRQRLPQLRAGPRRTRAIGIHRTGEAQATFVISTPLKSGGPQWRRGPWGDVFQWCRRAIARILLLSSTATSVPRRAVAQHAERRFHHGAVHRDGAPRWRPRNVPAGGLERRPTPARDQRTRCTARCIGIEDLVMTG